MFVDLSTSFVHAAQQPFIVRVGAPAPSYVHADEPPPSFAAGQGSCPSPCREKGTTRPAPCRAMPSRPPRDISEWQASGWCGEDDQCPNEAVGRFVRKHIEERKLAKQYPGALVDRRFIVCKPMGGLGNWIAGLLSCAAMAMATNRSMLLAPPPPTPPEKTTSYDCPVETLFDFPIDMSLEVLGEEIKDIPFLVDDRGRARDEGLLQMIDLRTQDLLCLNFTHTYHRPLAVMPAHLWLGAITRNEQHAGFFKRNFGKDAYGAAAFTQFVGPWLLTPTGIISVYIHIYLYI